MSDERKKAGPDTETLKIEGSWQHAVGKALKRGKQPAPEKKPTKKNGRRGRQS